MNGVEKAGILAVISVVLLAAFFMLGAMMKQEPVVTAFAPANFQGDLRPILISYSPIGPQTGDAVSFNVTVKNVGTEDPATPFVIALYIDDINVGNGSMASLPAGDTESILFDAWTATSELHDVYVVMDPDNTTGGNKDHSRLNSSVAVDWPVFRQNNERWGVSHMDGPVNGTVSWTKSLPESPESYSMRGLMAAADGKIFLMTSNYVLAYDAISGAQIWNYTPGLYSSFGSPIITNGTLYVMATQGNRIYALNVTTGSEIWNADAGSNVNMLIYNNRKVFHDAYNAGLFARDSASGELLWNFTTYEYNMRQPAVSNNTIFLLHNYINFTALDADSGAVKWQNTDYENKDMWMSSTAYGNAYFALGSGMGTSSFFSIHAQDGSLDWTMNFSGRAGAPFTIFNDTVIIGTMPNYTSKSDGILARDAFTGAEKWTVNINNQYSYCAVVTSNNGMYYLGLGNNTLLAISTANGSVIWGSELDGSVTEMVPYKGKLYVATSSNTLYTFGEKATLSMSQMYNDTIIDRDGVSDSYPDAFPLEAIISDGSTGMIVNFYASRIVPSASSAVYLGSNYSVSGTAMLTWNPSSSFMAGRYVWFANSSTTNTLDNSTVRVHGGINTSFRYSDTYPNSSYNGTDNVSAAAFVSFLGNETLGNMSGIYNFLYNFTLTKPAGGKLYSGLYRQTDISTIITYIGNGTGYSCEDMGGSDYFHFSEEDFVPNTLEVVEGNPPYYYLNFTCNSTVCPGYAGMTYLITFAATKQDDYWEDPVYKSYAQLNKWNACTGNPGTEGSGWEFAIFNNTTVSAEFWNGTIALTDDAGTWTATLNASADFFVRNDTISRNFTVTGTGSISSAVPLAWSSPSNLTICNNTYFNATWSGMDIGGFNSSILEANISGAWLNYTDFTRAGNTSMFTEIMTNGNGTYGWRMHANDSSGAWNVTDLFTFNFTSCYVPPAPAPPAPSAPSAVTVFNESLSQQKPAWSMGLTATNNITVVDGVNQVIVGRGSTEPIDLTLTNTGNRVIENIAVKAEGIPSEWVSITPSFISRLGLKESVLIRTKISVPQFAPFAVYPVNFTARSINAKATYDLNTELTDKCKPCPPSGPWSACTEGVWFRTNYKCDSGTDYQCTAWQEEGSCAVVDYVWVLLVIIVTSVYMTWRYWRHEKPGQDQVASALPNEPPVVPQPPEPTAVKVTIRPVPAKTPKTVRRKRRKNAKSAKGKGLFVDSDNPPNGRKDRVKALPRKV